MQLLRDNLVNIFAPLSKIFDRAGFLTLNRPFGRHPRLSPVAKVVPPLPNPRKLLPKPAQRQNPRRLRSRSWSIRQRSSSSYDFTTQEILDGPPKARSCSGELTSARKLFFLIPFSLVSLSIAWLLPCFIGAIWSALFRMGRRVQCLGGGKCLEDPVGFDTANPRWVVWLKRWRKFDPEIEIESL